MYIYLIDHLKQCKVGPFNYDKCPKVRKDRFYRLVFLLHKKGK